MRSTTQRRPLATFSIVAYDLTNGDLGVAVASKFLAVGAVVPWARAGVGAVATQSWANTSYGPEGLQLMAEGLTAQEAMERLIAGDEERARRQVGLVDARGNAAAHTGEGCFPWAGQIVGQGYACQGNILVSEETVQAMAQTFEQADGELAERLLAALAAGQEAGGDSRGRQSAALLVVRGRGGYGGFNDRYLDLRVDDHPTPIAELQKLLDLHRLYLGQTDSEDLVPIDEAIALELQAILQRTGHYSGPITGVYDATTRVALEALCGIENLEERWRDDDQIGGVVLRFLRERLGG